MDNLIYKFWENKDLEIILAELFELDNTIVFEKVNEKLVFIKKNDEIKGTLEIINNIYYYNKI